MTTVQPKGRAVPKKKETASQKEAVLTGTAPKRKGRPKKKASPLEDVFNVEVVNIGTKSIYEHCFNIPLKSGQKVKLYGISKLQLEQLQKTVKSLCEVDYDVEINKIN